MAIFMLDCDSVTASASSVNSLVAQFSQIADSVNGYDTSCEDGFDFAGGKAAIAANIEACTTKVQNTVKLIEGAVSAHTTLQNSFSLDQNGAIGSETQNREDTGSATVPAGTTSYSPSYSTGGGGGGGYSGAVVGAGAAAGLSEIIKEPTSQNPTDITGKINAVDQVTVDVNKLDAANKTQFITGMTYNDLGYATFDDKYVIVCDTTLAKVGDNLVFTRPDGTKIDCVVGAVVDYSQQYKGNVSFIVNNNWNAQGANNLTFDLNTMKITNNGQYVPKKA